MQKKRFNPNLLFVVAILAVVGLAYYARKNNSDTMTFSVDPDAPVAEGTSTVAETRGIDNEEEPPPAEIADKDLAPLTQWVKDEALSLNETNVNLKERDDAIAEKVRSFGARQLAHLQAISQNPENTMNERILSIYMMGKNENARQNLIDVAAQEMATKEFEAHSTDEIKHNQEQAARVMAIDEIAARKDSVDNRLKDLQAVINQTNDDFIKQYAQKKSDQLKQ